MLFDYTEVGDIKIFHGDAREVIKTLPDDSIDLVFTDPPYDKENLFTYDILADECPRVMSIGANLLTIVGHHALPEVIKKFDEKLKYVWTICMNQFTGPRAQLDLYKVSVTWKPILWYVKGHYKRRNKYLNDGIEITGKQGQFKTLHKWQQDITWAVYYIERFTNEGDTVLDPFLGSGTILLVCKQLNRKGIGIEIDENYYKTAVDRIRSFKTLW